MSRPFDGGHASPRHSGPGHQRSPRLADVAQPSSTRPSVVCSLSHDFLLFFVRAHSQSFCLLLVRLKSGQGLISAASSCGLSYHKPVSFFLSCFFSCPLRSFSLSGGGPVLLLSLLLRPPILSSFLLLAFLSRAPVHLSPCSPREVTCSSFLFRRRILYLGVLRLPFLPGCCFPLPLLPLRFRRHWAAIEVDYAGRLRRCRHADRR